MKLKKAQIGILTIIAVLILVSAGGYLIIKDKSSTLDNINSFVVKNNSVNTILENKGNSLVELPENNSAKINLKTQETNDNHSSSVTSNCPTTCNDNNENTYDYCNSSTNFQCAHQTIFQNTSTCPSTCNDFNSSTFDYCNSSTNYLCSHQLIGCTEGFLDEYTCVGPVDIGSWKMVRSYQYSNCSTVWKDYEACPYDCIDNKCSSVSPNYPVLIINSFSYTPSQPKVGDVLSLYVETKNVGTIGKITAETYLQVYVDGKRSDKYSFSHYHSSTIADTILDVGEIQSYTFDLGYDLEAGHNYSYEFHTNNMRIELLNLSL